jgi:hypothetical protein
MAAQALLVFVQAAPQQWPVPLTPQTPEVHWSLPVQAPTAIWAIQTPVVVLHQ